jgi:cysteinyl-tRNA synthetase
MAAQKKIINLKRVKTSTSNSTPKTVSELKGKYNQLPLHFLFGLEKEIDYQCESIDQYLSSLEDCKNFLIKIRKSKSLDSAQLHAANGLHSLDKIDSDLDIEAINETKNPEKFLKI